MKGRIVALLEDPAHPPMAACLDAGRLTDLLADPPETDPVPRLEAIYRARVTRRMDAMGAAFLDLGEGAEGFLKGAKGLRTGQVLLVQVARYAEAGKAAPVSDEPLVKGRYAILTPHAPGVNVSRRIRDTDEAARLRLIATDALEEAGLDPETGPGVILRSFAEGVDADTVAEDVAALAAIWAEAQGADDAPGLVVAAPDAETLAWREWVDPEPEQVLRGDAKLWEDLGIWDQIAGLFRARVDLGAGAWMSVEATSALIAVDVNTGGDVTPAAGLKTNLAMAEALPVALRLRGLGGLVLVDPAPLSKRDRPKLEAALKRAFRAEGIDTQQTGWTPSGLIELQRRRERRPLAGLIRRPD